MDKHYTDENGNTFVWDETKNKINKEKHNIDFETAVKVFNDTNKLEFYDASHSTLDEDRFITIGRIKNALAILVVSTDRKRQTRIISARKLEKREEKKLL